ncbi:MAG TPA: GntR family transcriptional regulator [Casimicrobiaceae bacterium]|nr:GntR family transcriptional regulator [Casimicrobiaceae bacterium]
MSIARFAKPQAGGRRTGSARRARAARIDKGNGGALAYAELRRRIVSLDLKPGADLDEASLVRELGVSRTPVRSALVRLSSEGLVLLLPNRGARVANMDLPQLHEHLEAFELLQRAATRLAALRRTDAEVSLLVEQCTLFEEAAAAGDAERMIDSNWDFHFSIARASHNRSIEKMYGGLLTENLRIARLAMAYVCYGSAHDYRTHLDSILREHRAMVKAIRDGSADAADKLAASHANLARVRVTSYLGNNLTASMSLADVGARAKAA